MKFRPPGGGVALATRRTPFAKSRWWLVAITSIQKKCHPGLDPGSMNSSHRNVIFLYFQSL